MAKKGRIIKTCIFSYELVSETLDIGLYAKFNSVLLTKQYAFNHAQSYIKCITIELLNFFVAKLKELVMAMVC